MKKVFVYWVLLLIVLFSVCSANQNIKLEDRQSWYEQFITDPDIREELDYMDSQLLGESTEHKSFQGLITDAYSKMPINNANIRLVNSRSKVLAETKSNEKGIFFIKPIKDWGGYLQLSVEAMGHSSIAKTVTPDTLTYGLDFEMIPTKTYKIEKGEIKVIEDSLRMARLSVPSEILKRMDGKRIQFPVQISLSYIDPEKDLKSMPGIDMLAIDKGNGARVMASYGAVNIEAIDSTGKEVRIDPEMIRKTGKSTELWMRLNDAHDNRKNMEAWDFDPSRGDNTWKKSIKLLNKPGIMMYDQVKKKLSYDFLIKYAKDVANRFNNQASKGSKTYGSFVYGCIDKKQITGSQVRFNPNSDPDEILNHILDFIIVDLEMMKKIPNRYYCNLGGGGNSDSQEGRWFIQTFWKIYDAEMNGIWQKAGSYNCSDNYNAMSYPSSLTSGFNYSPLETILDQICTLAEKNNWQNAIEIRNVDLIPFNLDKPFKGTPILIKLKEPAGDGRFKAVIESKGRDGNYYFERIIYSPSKEFELKTLVPDNKIIEVKIYGDFGQKKPTALKKYKIPEASASYKWNETRTHFLKEDGSPVNWMVLEELTF